MRTDDEKKSVQRTVFRRLRSHDNDDEVAHELLHIADWCVVPVEKTKHAPDVVMQGVK